MPYGGGSSSTVATFPWSPETGNADLMLQNINDGTFPALGMSTSLGWNESFLPEDYPSEYPSELLSYFSQTPEQHIIPKLPGPGEPLSLSQVPPLPSSSGASSSIGLGLSPNGDFSCDEDFFANNFLPGPSTVASNTGELFEELSQRVRDYPKKILQRDFWSPFIHHSLYRCAQGGMAEPLGIALACASAYVDQPETCLAALHAVSVYQILSSLDDRSRTTGPVEADRPQTRSGLAAESHISFLLKMTRRLCSLYKEAVTSDTETDWSRWKFAESLRRCVFFVNLINVLAARCRRFHFDYFEPLDDALILQMPLPTTEQTWRARNETQWQICREDTQLVRPAPTLQKLMEIDDAGQLDRATLTPLTRIILACARVNLEADWRDG
ncbi:C6 zinc finger domain-containing protein [Trichophyton equinum CBS 127.97]|uniref:C6 zinc finger domain-containing protein n=1 Tax=Trichophyton equinum (strain ATCC MYA-4606 / CBS 127.97) TaxID=559882 RepID=F2PR77_TRIEC|nr:C6 zinc finger domain-containing protein [Trichophyton equinum CBS 127.97]